MSVTEEQIKLANQVSEKVMEYALAQVRLDVDVAVAALILAAGKASGALGHGEHFEHFVDLMRKQMNATVKYLDEFQGDMEIPAREGTN